MILECDIELIEQSGLTPTTFCYLYYLYYGKSYPFTIPSNVLESLQEQQYIKILDEEIVLRPKFRNLIKVREYTKTVDSWIDEWLNLFPENVSNSGIPIKSDRESCIKKMEWFVKKYKQYTKEDIIEVTKMYLQDRQRKNWEYCIAAQYLINKNNISSPLASLLSDMNARITYRNNLEAGGGAFHRQI